MDQEAIQQQLHYGEDGSVKRYIIYTTKLVDGREATTEAESKTEAVTEDASQAVNN